MITACNHSIEILIIFCKVYSTDVYLYSEALDQGNCYHTNSLTKILASQNYSIMSDAERSEDLPFRCLIVAYELALKLPYP